MNPTLTAPVFLDRLRFETTPSHTALEALPVSVSIMSPQVSHADYTKYLSLMHDVVKDAEDTIFPIVYSAMPDIDIHPKAQFIETDLQTLGFKKEINDKPLSSKIQNCTTAFALGVMYVIEGSSLGGRVILKNITAALGHNADSGATYFAGYGAQTGSHWKIFLGALMAYEHQHNCELEIIKGANFAFDAINLHFTANSPQ